MIKKNDIHSFEKFCSLVANQKVLGKVHFQYNVHRYNDIKASDTNNIDSKDQNKFFVQCTQRIIITNSEGLSIIPSSDLSSYSNYPALLNTFVEVESQDGLIAEVIDYSPQTVNTKIERSGTLNNSKGQTSGSSRSSTIGSSTSQTNSYGTSVTVSATAVGEDIIPSASVSANYEHSSGHTHSKSRSMGSESSNSNSQSQSDGDSMSIKDWGAYALINPTTNSPTWNFGQEYPWDAIMCRKTDDTKNPNNDGQVKLILPSSMLLRLHDGHTLYPPSHLSTFGFSFLTKVSWIITTNGPSDIGEIKLKHHLNYFSASHSIDGQGDVSVYIDKTPTSLTVKSNESLETSLDLFAMGVKPIGLPNDSAITGFSPKRFIQKPVMGTATSKAEQFKLISPYNNLIMQDTTAYTNNAIAGFSIVDNCLTGIVAKECTSLDLALYFKIIDFDHEYALHIKHWKSGNPNFKLTLLINGDQETSIIKYVDANEGDGGENNLTTISLRNLDYSSMNFHDYLKLGLNSISIKIEQVESTIDPQAQYKIRAISIERV